MLQHHKSRFFIKNTVKLQLHGIFVPNGNVFKVIFCVYIIYYFVEICKLSII